MPALKGQRQANPYEFQAKPQQRWPTEAKANQQKLMQKTKSDELQLILCQVPEGVTRSHSLGSTCHTHLPHSLWWKRLVLKWVGCPTAWKLMHVSFIPWVENLDFWWFVLGSVFHRAHPSHFSLLGFFLSSFPVSPTSFVLFPCPPHYPFPLVSLTFFGFCPPFFPSFSWLMVSVFSQTSNNICCHTLKFPAKLMILNSAHWIISVWVSYIRFKPAAKLKHVFHFLPKPHLPPLAFCYLQEMLEAWSPISTEKPLQQKQLIGCASLWWKTMVGCLSAREQRGLGGVTFTPCRGVFWHSPLLVLRHSLAM